MNPPAKHVGIILDGNRRFARRLMLKPWKGHEWGAKKLESLLEWCREFDVRELTLYSFSLENFQRPKEEFDFLMKLFQKNFEGFKDDERLDRYGVRIKVIGRLELFPQAVQDAMRAIMEQTKDHSNYVINFAMAYGGRQEIVDAARAIAAKVESGKLHPADVNEETLREHLYLQGDPDLIIRTGGEKRTSNFLMWQSSYSEWFFLEKSWPEFEKDDFAKILSEYQQRDRRFGT